MYKNLIAILGLLVLAQPSRAQSSIDPDARILKKHTHLEINCFQGRFNITEKNTIDTEFHKNFEKHSRESIYYSDFDKLQEFHAWTVVPHKKKHKTIYVTSTETQDIVQPGIFYGGYKRLEFVFPSLNQPCVGHLDYVKQISDPHLISPFYFDDYLQTTESVYSVTFPSDVKINPRIFGEQTEALSFEETNSGNKTTYKWTLRNVPAITREKNAPSRGSRSPHIIILIDSYSTKSETFTVLSDVKDLYGWYVQLVNQSKNNFDEDLHKIVDELLVDKSSRRDSAMAIFNWVQKNIKYVAFEDGMAGFVPRGAADVLNKRYGDCKDMANLLHHLLDYAKIESYLTWIGTRAKPYSYLELPSTVSDNHMICAAKINNELIFLDATNPYVCFGYPTSMIQGKEALVGINDSVYQLITVPIVETHQNKRKDVLDLSFAESAVVGSFKSTLTGYHKDNFEIASLRAEIRNESEHLRDFFSIGDNNIKIFDERFAGLGNENDQAEIQFQIDQPNYARFIGDKIYVNLNFHKKLPGERVDTDQRINSMEFEFKHEYTQEVTLQIPEGYSVAFLPNDQDFSNDQMTVQTSYSQNQNTLSMTKTYALKDLLVTKDEFANWNTSLEFLTSVNQESVILKKQ